MRTSVVAFAISLLIGMVLTRLVRDLAIRFGWYDQPGNRKIHVRPTPRLGGLAVTLGFLAPLIGLFFYNNPNYSVLYDDPSLWLALGSGGSLMFFVGLVDDFRGLRPVVKLVAQVAAGGFVYACGIQIDAVQIPFVGLVHLGIWSLPITMFWMVLVTNAVNLIDGMDGLAGGVVVLGGGTLFLMSIIQGNAVAAVILAALVGATLGFLVFNLNPASIFLGDAGSLFLGFSLGLIAIHSNQKSSAFASILSAMLVLGLPIFDLSMTVIRRWLMRKPIFSADQHHVHHLLLRSGLSQRQSVAVLLGTAAILELLALSFVFQNDSITALVLAIVVVLVGFAVHKLNYRELIYRARADVPPIWGHELAAAVTKVQLLRSALRRIDQDQSWPLLTQAAAELGIHRLVLRFGEECREWTGDPCESPAIFRSDLWFAGQTVGQLEVHWGVAASAEPAFQALVLVIADGISAVQPRAWTPQAASS